MMKPYRIISNNDLEGLIRKGEIRVSGGTIQLSSKKTPLVSRNGPLKEADGTGECFQDIK